MLANPPTFVVCAPRSGSTWLRLMLNDHPEVAAGLESYVFSDYAGLEHMIAAYYGKRGKLVGLGDYLPEERFYHHVRAFVDGMFNDFLARENKQFLVEKSVRHSFFLQTIHRLYPEARIIHLVRDGRDVALSIRAASQSWNPHWPADIGGAAAVWKSYTEAILRDIHLFPQERVLPVRYEDLLCKPGADLRRILAFVGVSEGARNGAVVEEIVARNRIDVYKAEKRWQSGNFFRKGTSRQWKEAFSPEDQAAFNAAAGELLIQLGYESSLNWS